MVTAEDCNSVGEADLEGDQERHGFHTIVAAIDIVTHEEVVRIRRLSANLEELKQIMELTVNITANSHGSANLLHVGLVYQNFFSLQAPKRRLRIVQNPKQ